MDFLKGLECPDCGCIDSVVYKTERQPGSNIKRYRRCTACGKAFITSEKVSKVSVSGRKRRKKVDSEEE